LNFDGQNQDQFSIDPYENTGTELKPGLIPAHFRVSKLSYITLFFLLLVWPIMSVILIDDPSEALNLISISPILMAYLPTIIMQWLLFLFIYATLVREETGLAGIGFNRIRLIHFLYALAFDREVFSLLGHSRFRQSSS